MTLQKMYSVSSLSAFFFLAVLSVATSRLEAAKSPTKMEIAEQCSLFVFDFASTKFTLESLHQERKSQVDEKEIKTYEAFAAASVLNQKSDGALRKFFLKTQKYIKAKKQIPAETLDRDLGALTGTLRTSAPLYMKDCVAFVTEVERACGKDEKKFVDCTKRFASKRQKIFKKHSAAYRYYQQNRGKL